MSRVIIIGGGFTGTAVAIRLLQSATRTLDITIVEPRESPGGGLAYGGGDPDHRVNATHKLLVMFPDDITHFTDWFERTGGLSRDPEALWQPTDTIFVRRSEVCRYLTETLDDLSRTNSSKSRVRHLRSRATAVERTDRGLRLTIEDGTVLDGEIVVLALAGQAPAIPGGLSEAVLTHPQFVADPLKDGALEAVPPDASVLLVGSGLTSADAIATLDRQGHRGPIRAVSRRGLRPEPQGEAPDVAELIARLSRPLPRFLERHGENLSLMQTFRALRRDLRTAKAEGRDSKPVFDDARDAASRLWPGFTLAEKRRFLHHLKSWYDTHRYRMVPQTGAVLQRLEAKGQLEFQRARFDGAVPSADGRIMVTLTPPGEAPKDEPFDTVVLCTGPRSFGPAPLFSSLLEGGLATTDPAGLGLAVDGTNRVLDARGEPQNDLWAFGLLTRGRFGDMTALPQIAFRLHAALPELLHAATGENQS